MSPFWRRRRDNDRLDPAFVDDVITRHVALARRLNPETATRLRELTVELAGGKTWEGVRDFEIDSAMIVLVAANAAIPILGLDTSLYGNVRSVILRPSAVASTSVRGGPVDGLLTDEPIVTIGLTTPNEGPMSISWDAALGDSNAPETGRNVVIHEFAHKIDMSDGYTDGSPPLRGEPLARWTTVLADEYEHLKHRPSDDVLRAYAWTNRAEFFAVATEAFFCTPHALADGKPVLYSALADFYRQDPARWGS